MPGSPLIRIKLFGILQDAVDVMNQPARVVSAGKEPAHIGSAFVIRLYAVKYFCAHFICKFFNSQAVNSVGIIAFQFVMGYFGLF